MLSENYIYHPEQLNGEELDAFLERGWYRMGQSLFTTHFVSLQDHVYRVFWLRYNLTGIRFRKYRQRLLSRNKDFNVSLKPMELTDELEELYTLYKTGIDFEPALSVQHWLYGDQVNNVYDTQIFEIRDDHKLIAAGVFDNGNESIAGIMNFYHPDYKKYSLGKYLMLLKMEYAISKKMKWYYPGYVVYNYPAFDYKLFADKKASEIFIPELESWKLYDAELIEQYGNSFANFLKDEKDKNGPI